jgi:hypothetical protein
MNWRPKNNTTDQWNKKLVLWKNKQDQQTASQVNKRRKEMTQINKIRDEKGNIITDTNEFQMII